MEGLHEPALLGLGKALGLLFWKDWTIPLIRFLKRLVTEERLMTNSVDGRWILCHFPLEVHCVYFSYVIQSFFSCDSTFPTPLEIDLPLKPMSFFVVNNKRLILFLLAYSEISLEQDMGNLC